MDIMGYTTYLLPVLGEWGDLVWAPLSAYIFYKTFEGKIASVGAFINLAEEIMPFSDFVPTFTLAYLYQKVNNRQINNEL
jgi:hypothetical protein